MVALLSKTVQLADVLDANRYIVHYLKFETVNKEKLKRWNLPVELKGVMVTAITNRKQARELSPGDVIFKYKRSRDKKFIDVRDGKRLFKVIQEMKNEESIAFYIYSKGRKKLVAVKARKSK